MLKLEIGSANPMTLNLYGIYIELILAYATAVPIALQHKMLQRKKKEGNVREFLHVRKWIKEKCEGNFRYSVTVTMVELKQLLLQ